jgi:hypothetical protein
MESQTTLVWTNCTVVLNTESSIDMELSVIINPNENKTINKMSIRIKLNDIVDIPSPWYTELNNTLWFHSHFNHRKELAVGVDYRSQS